MPSVSTLLSGLFTSSVPVEEYASTYLRALNSILPSRVITRAAGVDLSKGWKTITKEVVDAHRDHLVGVWAPAHEALAASRPGGWAYGAAWKRAVQASDAYGRTIGLYIDFRQLWMMDLVETKEYSKLRNEGRKWDQRTAERVRDLVDALDHLDQEKHESFARLLPGGGIPEGIGQIAYQTPDLAGEPRFGSVAEFI